MRAAEHALSRDLMSPESNSCHHRRMGQGAEDLRRAADALASRLPEPLAPLAHIAFNYRWAWLPGGPELFESVAPHRWLLCANNPVRLLQEVSAGSLEHAARDEQLLGRIADV